MGLSTIRSNSATAELEWDDSRPVAAPARPIGDGNISRGYRELSKNKTLAGRNASRGFTGNEPDHGPNRLRMVSKLRKKQRFLIWKDVFSDMGRFFYSVVLRLNPLDMIREIQYSTNCETSRLRIK